MTIAHKIFLNIPSHYTIPLTSRWRSFSFPNDKVSPCKNCVLLWLRLLNFPQPC